MANAISEPRPCWGGLSYPVIAIVIVGVLVRISVYAVLYPFNPDNHLEVLAHLMNFGELPLTGVYDQSFHPPLYYLLAVPFGLAHSAKVVQFFSLLLAVANLLLLAWLVRFSGLIRNAHAQLHAIAFAAFLPEFVRFSLFASNDCLAFLMGSTMLCSALGYNAVPSTRRLCWMSLALGLGLLTKGTLLAFAPVFAGLVVLVGVREGRSLGAVLRALGLLFTIAGVVGSYKFVENLVYFGHPLPSFEYAWMQEQRGTYRGLRSLVDFDLVALFEHPYVSPATTSKIPVLLFATFWYAYVYWDSLLNNAWSQQVLAIPRLVYAAGLLPTLLMVSGAIVLSRRTIRCVRQWRDRGREAVAETGRQICLLGLLASLALVISYGLRLDTWSCFQGRLLFHGFFAILLVYATGLEVVLQRVPSLRHFLHASLCAVYAVLLFNIGFEVTTELAKISTAGG